MKRVEYRHNTPYEGQEQAYTAHIVAVALTTALVWALLSFDNIMALLAG